MNDKLLEILEYYKDTYSVMDDLGEIYTELVNNNAEVKGNSFYCPIWNHDVNGWILLAGTKDRADMWVLKKIIRLIKSGQTVYTMFNGNADYLFKQFSRYNVKMIEKKDNGIMFLSFN